MSKAAGRGAPAGLLPGEILRRVRRLEIRTRAVVTESFAGHHRAVFKGRGMEFSEVREYVPGDDVRTIDWNVTARYRAPYVRLYAEERELTVFLIVDLSGSLVFGSAGGSKRELAAELAALLAFAAIKNQDKVGLLTFTDRIERLIPPRKGRPHGLRLIREVLYPHCAGRGSDLAAACEAARHVLRRRSVVFLVSDFLMPLDPVARVLGGLARRQDLIAVEIRDPLEEILAVPPGGSERKDWAALGLLEWEDPETGRRVLFDPADGQARRRVGERFADQRRALEALLRRQRIDQVTLRVGSDPVEPLLAFFRLRERRLAREQA